MSDIPIYALYGEESYAEAQNWLHWETITSRSRLYGFRIAPHRHEAFFQILVLARGGARVTLDGTETALAAPAVVTVPALVVHGFSFTPEVEGFVLTLYDRDVSQLLSEAPEIAAGLTRPRLVGPQAEGLADLIADVEALTREADRAAPGQVTAVRARLVLLLVAIHRLARAGAAPAETVPARAAGHLRGFLSLVDRHYRDMRALAFYADALGMSATHLNRLCRRQLGTSALAVIERRILIEAKRYLRFSTLSVKEIGILLGYPDPAYFSRFFARATGVTPTRFRAAAGQGGPATT